MPADVDRYFKEVKKSNPEYSDAQAWATAWSIYCKHKKPDSPSCHKPTEEYLKGRSAALRVAAKYAGTYDKLVENKNLLPKPLSARYIKDLKAKLGQGSQVKAIKSETFMPRGWDYGNYTVLEISLPDAENVKAAITMNVGADEVSGNAALDAPYGVVSLPRVSTPDKFITQLVSEISGVLRK